MFKVLVCVSGGGTNLQAILDAQAAGAFSDAEVCGVISNNAGAYALKRAEAAGVPSYVVSRADHADRAEFDAALLARINDIGPDLIVLAGFLVQIPEAVVKAYPGKIINIHPSLIPSFCGVGFYGLKVHEEALARGVKVTGATVHFVDENMDTGPIILQKAVAVKEGDTPQVLQRRVMEEAEWILLPRAIDLVSRGLVTIENGVTHIKED